ncbi:MAG: polysaccharide biosynthesis/export family protein [Candidatus Auribacterota bacterium]|nr:polysaccharide biosynthesis/export family protein [Candidatus Auribacterota bacterium]
MRYGIHYLCGLLILMAAGCSGGPSLQSPPAPAEVATSPTPAPTSGLLPRAVDLVSPSKEIYLIGPGDVLSVHVYEEPELSGRFSVSRKGMITWSWIGEVKVAGLSLESIKSKLSDILTRDYIRRPMIKVDIEEYHSQVVYFFGNVVHPGVNRLGENKSLLQSFLQAGGPKNWGDCQITILRNKPNAGESRKEEVGLQALLRGEADILLKDCDIVTVGSPEAGIGIFADDRVYVVGAVINPRAIIWREKMTALDVLMSAGGLTESASGNGARLIRGVGEEKKEYELRLDDILDGERRTNVILLPGDQIIIPESFF